MSKADVIFKKNARLILEHGTSTEGQNVRPHWPDGTPAYTIKQFGAADVFDLQEEFPAVTVRKTGLKSAWDEILWIYQRKSNNIHDLKPHIWDEWADATGSIQKAYGYQIGKPSVFRIVKTNEEATMYEQRIKEMRLPSAKVVFCPQDELYMEPSHYKVIMDQMDAVLYQLKYEPFSRRILTSMWNVDELTEMGLQPCAWNVTFCVTDEKREDGKLTLNATLNQRSNDLLAANNWNTAQYALLVMAVAQVSDMVPGKLLHVITDQHIYDRHVDIVKELLDRKSILLPKFGLILKLRTSTTSPMTAFM